MPDSKPLGDVDLETLFDEIIAKTEQREAFSPIKEANIGFSAIEDMKALREEFLAAETELDLWFALVKLSNARRDRHLWVMPAEGGLPRPERWQCVAAPILVLPEILDVRHPTFFVAWVEEGVATPQVGDVIVGVNGRSMDEYLDEFALLRSHSTLPRLYWDTARFLPMRTDRFPLGFYSERLHLTLEDPTGERYYVSLPYRNNCQEFYFADPYSSFVRVMERDSFFLSLDKDREIVLLEWGLFHPDVLIQDVVDLVEYGEKEEILDWDIIIDVTFGGGGLWGSYVIQRLVDRPFLTTFGNLRLSDQSRELIDYFASIQERTDEPDIFGLNLSRSYVIDWARSDATEAIERGEEYTASVPFKLYHLPKDSDGVLQPAPVHFSGRIAIVNARTRGGSQLDHFTAMFVDNGLATFVGVPTAGFSNTWEGIETLYFPGTSQPVARFMWSLGHTFRPNGEILEGNPAQPDVYMPVTRENFQDYYKLLVERAIASLEP